MVQLEHDYQGGDYSLNVKAMNPSPADTSGIYIGSYLQSLTKNFALGFDLLHQRQTSELTETSMSYHAKYAGSDKNWIATATLSPMSILQATYWHKLSDKVEAAAELNVIAMPMRRDAIATLGAKYDLRMSTFRAQVDSTGKVSALLEQRFAPTFGFTVAGEIDHFKVIQNHVSVYGSSRVHSAELGKGRRRRNDRKHEPDTGGDGDGDGIRATATMIS